MGFMDLDSRSLGQGEQVAWQGNPSWRAAPVVLLKAVGIGIVVLAVLGLLEAVGVDIQWVWWTVVLVLFVIGLVLTALFVRHRFLYVLTDRQVIVRRGLVGRSVRTSSLDRIQNTTMSQTVIARLMRVGTIRFATAAGAGDAELRFVGVERPLEIERIARELITRGQTSAAGPVEPVV